MFQESGLRKIWFVYISIDWLYVALKIILFWKWSAHSGDQVWCEKRCGSHIQKFGLWAKSKVKLTFHKYASLTSVIWKCFALIKYTLAFLFLKNWILFLLCQLLLLISDNAFQWLICSYKCSHLQRDVKTVNSSRSAFGSFYFFSKAKSWAKYLAISLESSLQKLKFESKNNAHFLMHLPHGMRTV